MSIPPIDSGETTSRSQEGDAFLDAALDMCLAVISGATGCRCVGIRVEEEGDFPLVRSLGFSEEFVEQDRSLLPAGGEERPDGEERFDLLECLCGKVIRGQRRGCEELFDSKGCLWVNDFSDTDKISTEVKDEMRTYCLEEGFQSFALVPCRPNRKTLGLLHVCDRRRGLLSETLVDSLEETGRCLAKLFLQLKELRAMVSRPPDTGIRLARVLVVDDDREMAELVQKMVEAGGHDVSAAFTARQALQFLGTEKFDLVITDLNMPSMSGLEFAKEIRHRWQPYAPPVVLMSGTSSEGIPPDDKSPAGIAAFLHKPFSAEALVEVIRTALT